MTATPAMAIPDMAAAARFALMASDSCAAVAAQIAASCRPVAGAINDAPDGCRSHIGQWTPITGHWTPILSTGTRLGYMAGNSAFAAGYLIVLLLSPLLGCAFGAWGARLWPGSIGPQFYLGRVTV